MGAFYLVDGRGQDPERPSLLPNWPISVTSFRLVPLLAEGASSSAIAADFDGDGRPEAAFHGNASDPLILPADPGAQTTPGSLPTAALPERLDPETGQPSRGIEPTRRFGADSQAERSGTMAPLFAHPSAGDLDQDGTVDLITQGTYLDVAQRLSACTPGASPTAHLLGMWDGRTGAMAPGSPVPIEDLSLFGSQAIADIDGDDYPEVLAGSAGYYLHAVNACGNEPEGWPKFTGQWIMATPAVGDIDGDDVIDVVAMTRSGWLYAWRTNGSTDGVIAWESFHHDNLNTGNLGVDLEQGVRRRATVPLPVGADGHCLETEEPPPDPEPSAELSPAGGCSCGTPARRTASAWAALLALAATIALRRGRRRRRF
jgi:hypothetical protein